MGKTDNRNPLRSLLMNRGRQRRLLSRSFCSSDRRGRAGTQIGNSTQSGNSNRELNSERELKSGAQLRAGIQIRNWYAVNAA